MMYQHPTCHVDKGFEPATLHRPSHIYMFHRMARQLPTVEQGQFDDAN